MPHKRGGRQGTYDHEGHRAETRESTETKSAHKTTELIVYVLGVAGVLIAAALVADASFESFRVSEKGAVSKNRGLAFFGTDNKVCLSWLAGALQQLRPEGQGKVVGYLEAVSEEIVFEMKMDPRS